MLYPVFYFYVMLFIILLFVTTIFRKLIIVIKNKLIDLKKA